MRYGFYVFSFAVVGAIAGIVYFVDHRLYSQRSEVAALKEYVKEMQLILQQQSAVLHRALGKSIPTQLPPDTELAISGIESRLLQAELRPKNAAEAEVLRQELASIVKHLPPWAETDLLPRLNRLNWSVEVLWTITPGSSKTGRDLEALFSSLQTLLDRQPENAPAELVSLVTTSLNDAQVKVEMQTREESLKQAKAALRGEGDCVAAWSRLETYSQNNREVKELRDSLRLKVMEKTSKERLDQLRVRLESAKKLLDNRLRVSGIMGVQEMALSLLLDQISEHAETSTSSKTLQEFIQACTHELQTMQLLQTEEFAKKQRGYQKWALEQIRAFNEEFKSAEAKAKENSLVYGKTWTLELVDSVQLVMKTRLLTINASLLEPPVLQLFNEAYGKAWENQANITGAQVSVAESVVTIKKKTLEDIAP